MATGASAQETQAAIAPPVPDNVTPEQALDLLKAGNAGFITDAPYRAADTRERRLEIAAGQKPFTVLGGCSESRVSPELLFGRGLGELFIIRVAGNTVDLTALGSIEYAVAHLGVPLIVVLGHECCGAVAAAVDVVDNNVTFEGAIGAMVEPIIPAVLSVKGSAGDLVENSVRANVERVIARLLSSGVIIENLVEEGKLMVVGARYDLEDGIVDFI
ncbi:carbonic anhydrase [Tabrizicola sp.]|uniref:carbonic anhydrase n=1 Tax=Tabrizicola sp. TaxID=2005166 RepID=UPI00286A652A|nr:carbonic anhydrase [Tabrizicola sp.]